MTAWREQTIRNKERRQGGVDALQNYQKRRAFDAWRDLLLQKNERRQVNCLQVIVYFIVSQIAIDLY